MCVWRNVLILKLAQKTVEINVIFQTNLFNKNKNRADFLWPLRETISFSSKWHPIVKLYEDDRCVSTEKNGQ